MGRSGDVIERNLLSRAPSSSYFGGTICAIYLCCVLEQDTFILASYWFNPGRPITDITEKLLTGT